MAVHTVSAEDRARTNSHFLEELLVELEDPLDSVNADIHGEQDGDHQQHGDPDAQQALQLSIPLTLDLNAEDPRVEYAVEHDEEDAERGGNGRACARLNKISLGVNIEDGQRVNKEEENHESISHPGQLAVWHMLLDVIFPSKLVWIHDEIALLRPVSVLRIHHLFRRRLQKRSSCCIWLILLL